MKLMCIGDIHIEERLPFSNAGNNRLTTELGPSLIQVVNIAKKEGVRVLIIAGDIFNNVSVTPEEHHFFHNFLAVASEQFQCIYAIPGNHELDERGKSFIKTISKSLKHMNIVATNKWGNTSLKYDTSLTLVSFARENEEFLHRAEAAHDKLLEYPPYSRKILVAHQPVQGAKLKAVTASKGIPADYFSPTGRIGKMYNLCIFGDFHRPQLLPYKAGFYTGSVIQLDFRDEGSSNCCWIVDADTLEFTPRRLQNPKFNTILVSQQGGSNKKYTVTPLSKLHEGGYLKIIFTGKKNFVKMIQERVVNHYQEKLNPKRLIVPSPVITDRQVPIASIIKRELKDEELVEKVVDNAASYPVSDRLLYDTGLHFIKQAKKRKK